MKRENITIKWIASMSFCVARKMVIKNGTGEQFYWAILWDCYYAFFKHNLAVKGK